MRTLLLITIWATVLASQPVAATNIAFLPGDAFFHGLLTQEDVERIGDQEVTNISLHYVGLPIQEEKLCGYMGLYDISLQSLSAEERRGIVTAHHFLRTRSPRLVVRFGEEEPLRFEDGSQKLFPGRYPRSEELNPISLFVYSKDFDIKEYHLGLKYDETVRTSSEARHIAHEAFLKTFDASHADQAGAREVGPLPVESGDGDPSSPPGLTGPVKFILMMPDDLPKLFDRTPGTGFVIVEGDQVRWAEYGEHGDLSYRRIVRD
jgi:hypothetical protein